MSGYYAPPGPPYPKYLYSSRLGQVAIANSLKDELDLRNGRFNFSSIAVFVPLAAFPKTVWNEKTGESKVVSDAREETGLSADWLERGLHKPQSTEYPKAMHGPNDENAVIQSAEEEKLLRKEGWIDGHEYWTAKREAAEVTE